METSPNHVIRRLLNATDEKSERIGNFFEQIIESGLESPWLPNNVELMEHQISGVKWLLSLHESGVNGILADEMGLGKTLQVLSFLGELFARDDRRGIHLIVVPLTVIASWQSDIASMCKRNRVNAYVHRVLEVGSDRGGELRNWFRVTRNQIKREEGTWDVSLVITSYELILRDISAFAKLKFDYLIVDEAHRLKNSQTATWSALDSLDTQRRLLLTGTPLQNHLNELWSLLRFILPDLFKNSQELTNVFGKPFERGDAPTREVTASPTHAKRQLPGYFQVSPTKASRGLGGARTEQSASTVDLLQRCICPFILRRLKAEVAPDLPCKYERVISCPLSDLQLVMHRQFRDIVLKRATLRGAVSLEEWDNTLTLEQRRMVRPLTSFHNLVMQLRKLCNHPYLVLEDMRTIPDESYYPNLVASSGKLQVLDRLLTHLLAQQSKILIFSQMTTMLSVLESYLETKGTQWVRLDGNTKQEDRAGIIDAFNASDSDITVFLLSTRAGGVGINLQAADCVILFDSDWNPQQDLQAISRTHRIGQTKPVLIVRLVSQGPDEGIMSVEQRVLERAAHKLWASQTVLAEGVFDLETGNGGSVSGSTSEGSGGTTSSDCSSQADLLDAFEEALEFGAAAADASEGGSDDGGELRSREGFGGGGGSGRLGSKQQQPLMMSLFENSSVTTGQRSGRTSQGSDKHSVVHCESTDFSEAEIQRVCHRGEVSFSVSSRGSGAGKVATMNTVGPIDACWRTWLGTDVQYQQSKTESLIEELGRQHRRAAVGAAGGRKTRRDGQRGSSEGVGNAASELLLDEAVEQREDSRERKRRRQKRRRPQKATGTSGESDSDYEPESSTSSDPRIVGAGGWFHVSDVCQFCTRPWIALPMEGCALPVERQKGLAEVMLVCDGCENSYHLLCMGLSEVPPAEEQWYCFVCS